MALKIRLSRGGTKKRPFYKIVVAEALSPRDGKFVERLGSYNPMVAKDHAERLVLNVERAKYWISKSFNDVGPMVTSVLIMFQIIPFYDRRYIAACLCLRNHIFCFHANIF